MQFTDAAPLCMSFTWFSRQIVNHRVREFNQFSSKISKKKSQVCTLIYENEHNADEINGSLSITNTKACIENETFKTNVENFAPLYMF